MNKAASKLYYAIQNDPDASYLLKRAVEAANDVDCFDALHDAETLVEYCKLLCERSTS